MINSVISLQHCNFFITPIRMLSLFLSGEVLFNCYSDQILMGENSNFGVHHREISLIRDGAAPL